MSKPPMADTAQDNRNPEEISPSLDEDSSSISSSQVMVSRFISGLGVIFDCTIVFLSGGIPFWYYRLVHPKFSEEMELSNIASAQSISETNTWPGHYWKKKIQMLSNVWKTHRVIIGMILAPTFPLISVSALPKCSWAYIFAVLCLLYGSITFATCTIHAAYFHNINDSQLHCSSSVTSGGSFLNRNNLRFYVSLSLPSVWFVGFLGSFALTILLIMIGEQDSPHDLEKGRSILSTTCKNDRLKFLQVVVPLMLVTAATGFVRMRWALRSVLFVEESA